MIDVIRFCDVIDNCEDCPIYADTCEDVNITESEVEEWECT